MCKLMEDRVNETAREAKKENSIDIALNLLTLGTLSNDDIAKATRLTLEEVTKLAEQVKTNA